jgi:ADP-L-glycero-D-manno-heptose 6-epimerase
VNQEVRADIPEPNKIGASTPYDFNARNLTAYGGLLPVATMLEKLALKQIVGLKYFNVFGPFEDHKADMKFMVAESYRQILDTGKVRLFKTDNPRYADGEQMRDFIYVKDAVAVTLSFLEDRSPAGLFNCGTGKARTWKDLVTAVFSAMDLPVRIDYIEMPEEMRSKYQYFTEANMSKLRAAGYTEPFHSLEDAITDYVGTYLKKLV